MTGRPRGQPRRLSGIEARSIDYVPESERHGRVADQGPFWFLGNFHFFTIAIGFVGPSLGLSLGWTALAGTAGILFGTLFQAFHASQGAELGLPQMIQSRAQFGFRGVVVPLFGALFTFVGFNVVDSILVAAGLKSLWGWDPLAVTIALAALAAALAIWGHDWLHLAFKGLFWISLPLFTLLTAGIGLGHIRGLAALPPPPVAINWPAFVTQFAAAASYNITYAPYVSDYSRYLPRTVSRPAIIASVFAGASLSAIWLICLGAWLATRMGATDGLAVSRVNRGREIQNSPLKARCSQSWPQIASAAARAARAIVTASGSQPHRLFRPAATRIESTTLKPTKVKRAPNRGTTTPRNPNWARDWIICGRPSSAPWLAWKAWNRVPNRMPAVPAKAVQPSDSPRLGPTKPMAMVKKWKLPRNQNGP